MTIMKIIPHLLLYLVLFVAVASCDGNDDPVTEPEIEDLNLYESLQEMTGFDLLQKALTKSGLANTLLRDDQKSTLFAPTDAAFEAILGEDGIDGVTGPELRSLLNYHLLSGEWKLEDLPSYSSNRGYVISNNQDGPNGSKLSLLFDRNAGFRLNNSATVTEPNIETFNGYLHIVDAVLSPPTIAEMISQNPDLSELEMALDVSNTNTLQLAGPNTILAPVNDGFDSFYSEIGASGPSDIDLMELENLMQYHIIPDTNLVSSSIMVDSVYTLLRPGVNNVSISIDTLNSELDIIDFQSRESSSILLDVQARNGAMHLISEVLRNGE